ncbi:translation initiation factor eIF4e [Sporormia fimetaria CBS 119925]|uniref:Translation initiation factor eIF4e n=1 Tax=Sporormia fimetaria CBS 119925 TaxID=1340428 RepID=A0A6A6UUW9_9PLEO|nr:translation initiation factor eIF4e [Sporormia fimetaria CBS 119925]
MLQPARSDTGSFPEKQGRLSSPPKEENQPRTTPSLIAASLCELLTSEDPLPPQPPSSENEHFHLGVHHVLATVQAISRTGATSAPHLRGTLSDLANDLAVVNCQRILAAAQDPLELQAIVARFDNFHAETMAGRFPALSTSNLPSASSTEQSATASPARGTAMLNSIFKAVRVPEFRFRWQFWAEKGQSNAQSRDKTADSEDFASRPKPLGDQIISVKEFYQHFNNIPLSKLTLRDSIHLFHAGVKPLWEDPRNVRGGAYYFRVSKDVAEQFWLEICLFAVGDVLQGAVETKRESFNDDICGISYSVRWNAVQIAIWNRDAENEAGKEKLLAVILDKLSPELQPKKDSYWYKAHKEHKGFIAPSA